MPKLPPMQALRTRQDLIAPSDALPEARRLPINAIRPGPDQARRHFDIGDLIADIAERGILQPIIVRADPAQDGHYLIVAGERRWRAAYELGLADVPAIIRTYENEQDAAADSAVENLQRADLTVGEEAELYQTLQAAWGLSARKLAERLHLDRNRVTRALRIAADPETLAAVEAGTLTFTAAFEYLSSPPPDLAHYEPGPPPPETPELAHNEPPAADWGPVPAPPARPAPTREAVQAQAVFKPFLAFHKRLQTLDTAPLPPATRADLRDTALTLIEELRGLVAELEG